MSDLYGFAEPDTTTDDAESQVEAPETKEVAEEHVELEEDPLRHIEAYMMIIPN